MKLIETADAHPLHGLAPAAAATTTATATATATAAAAAAAAGEQLRGDELRRPAAPRRVAKLRLGAQRGTPARSFRPGRFLLICCSDPGPTQPLRDPSRRRGATHVRVSILTSIPFHRPFEPLRHLRQPNTAD